MENSEDDVDEDETEWKSTSTDLQIFPAACSATNFNKVPSTPPQRVILHFDLDCFYAQVEMIRNPALRNVPLGIQQKYIIVTCNYVARDHGVTKLMSVTDAKEKCPQLVLVKGEDLTHYRETSYKVTELLMSHCPLVERLGFDENFMDITEMVDRKLRETPPESNDYSFKGHIYNHAGAEAKAREHPSLAVGSHIAAELRAAIHSKLGLTGCAGIATNKVLAKLVSGTFKPNQQTTLLPENVKDIMGCLSGLRKVPGVGHQTGKRLQALGLVSVLDLQVFPLADLAKEFGGPTAQRLHNLSKGIDDSPVTPTGAPQSLSDEDSFKKMSSTKEVLQKVQDLLSSLVERMQRDGRQPLTFRLTVRRYSATNKWFSRESRQCPIPNHIGQKITSGSSDALAQLVTMAMKLFHKMVDRSASFHLTLINVCFSNLQSSVAAASGKGSITSFFTHNTSPGKTQGSLQKKGDLSQSGNSNLMDHGLGCDPDGSSGEATITQDIFHSTAHPESPPNAKRNLHGLFEGQSPVPVVVPQPQAVPCTTAGPMTDDRSNSPEWESRLPPNVDPEVFRLLPEDIQKELLSPAYAYTDPYRDPLTPATTQTLTAAAFDMPHISNNNPPQLCAPASSTPAPCKLTDSDLKDRKKAVRDLASSDKLTTMDQQAPPGPHAVLGGTSMGEGSPAGQMSSPQTYDREFPADVDPKVFSELPPDVQMELLSEWKQQRPVLKTPSTSKKQGRNNSATKDRKAAAKGSQTNNLLKYFKPN